MHAANGRCNIPTTDQTATRNNLIENEAQRNFTERKSLLKICFAQCREFITEWILWSLVSNSSKEEDRKTEDSRTAPLRVDSGIGLDLLGQDGYPPHVSNPASLSSPDPITLLFVFEDSILTKHLPYTFYSRWTNINALLHELALDGIIVHALWDVIEDMQITSGDWDARVRPGWIVEVWCFSDGGRGGWGGDAEGDDSSESGDSTCGDGGDTDGDGFDYGASEESSERGERDTIGGRGHGWWFVRWRERVEKERMKKKGLVEGPSWLMIVIWCTSIVVSIVVLSSVR